MNISPIALPEIGPGTQASMHPTNMEFRPRIRCLWPGDRIGLLSGASVFRVGREGG